MKYHLEMIKNSTMPQLHKDLIIGTILGDSSLKAGKTGAYLRFDQGQVNKEYLYYLFSIMSVYCTQSEPTERTYSDPRYNKEYRSYNFSTQSSPIFYPFAELFLDKSIKVGKVLKIVPLCIGDLLTPRALAFWLMDDGQYVKRGGITLCTDSFSMGEVLLLKSVLEEKYGLQCTIHNKNPEKGHYRIYISGKSLPVLRELVREFIHPSMAYKLGK
jgi:hypothetical protein